MTTRSSTHIKRYSLPLYHRTTTTTTSTTDPWNKESNTTYIFTCLEAEMCTIQGINPVKITVDISGISSKDTYVLYTKTPVYSPEEGTNFKGSGIYIPDCWFGDGVNTFGVPSKGGWYNVVQMIRSGGRLIEHYQAIITKDKTAPTEEYPTEQLALIQDTISTRDGLFGATWVSDWESLN